MATWFAQLLRPLPLIDKVLGSIPGPFENIALFCEHLHGYCRILWVSSWLLCYSMSIFVVNALFYVYLHGCCSVLCTILWLLLYSVNILMVIAVFYGYLHGYCAILCASSWLLLYSMSIFMVIALFYEYLHGYCSTKPSLIPFNLIQWSSNYCSLFTLSQAALQE